MTFAPAQTSATLVDARLEIADLELRTKADTFASLPSLLPTAWAHPGHDPGTEVTGELLGTWEIDLMAGAELGTATALEGAIDELDLLLGEVNLAGTLLRDGQARAFDLHLDVDEPVFAIEVGTTVSAEAPPAWTLAIDLDAVFDALPWGEPGSTLTLSDPATTNVFVFALRAHTSWTLTETP